MRIYEPELPFARQFGVNLAERLPRLAEFIKTEIKLLRLKPQIDDLRSKLDEVERTLHSVFIPKQLAAGNEHEFSFMAFSVPILTREQRNQLPVKPWSDISLSSGALNVRIVFDDFDKICWFHLRGFDDEFRDLARALAEVHIPEELPPVLDKQELR